MITAKGAERWAFAGVALIVALIAIRFGGGMMNHSLETRFIQEVLFEWQHLGQRYNARGENWPTFEGNNHVAYMETLLQRIHRQGLVSPQQLRRLAFAPRLKRLGRDDERLFLLLLPGHLVIFGMSAQTYARIDQQVDGVNDPARGNFTGRLAADENQMIGYWQL